MARGRHGSLGRYSTDEQRPDVLRHSYTLRQFIGYATNANAKSAINQPVRVEVEFVIDPAKLDVLAARALRSKQRTSRGLYGAVVCRLVTVATTGPRDKVPEGYVLDEEEGDNG